MNSKPSILNFMFCPDATLIAIAEAPTRLRRATLLAPRFTLRERYTLHANAMLALLRSTQSWLTSRDREEKLPLHSCLTSSSSRTWHSPHVRDSTFYQYYTFTFLFLRSRRTKFTLPHLSLRNREPPHAIAMKGSLQQKNKKNLILLQVH